MVFAYMLECIACVLGGLVHVKPIAAISKHGWYTVSTIKDSVPVVVNRISSIVY